MSDSVCSEFLHEKPFEFSGRQYLSEDKQKLLDHYRYRLTFAEEERSDRLGRLETAEKSQNSFHSALQNCKKANDEIFRLQTELSEVQDAIFAERQQLMDLQRENDLFKLHMFEEKRKLGELSSIVGAKHQKDTYYKDSRPGTSKASKDCSWCSQCKAFSGTGHNSKIGRCSTLSKHHLHTVYLPNENMNGLAMEIELLKNQLGEEKAVFESELAALEEESAVRDQESEMRKDADFKKLRELTQLAAFEEEQKNALTKEYLRIRHDQQQRFKHLESLKEELLERKEKLHYQYKSDKIDDRRLVKYTEKEEKAKTNLYASKFRKQVISNEENLSVVKKEYSDLQEVYSNKIYSLENEINELTENYRDLEERRRLTASRYHDDIEKLKETLNKVQAQHAEKPKTKKQPRQTFTQKLCLKCAKKYSAYS